MSPARRGAWALFLAAVLLAAGCGQRPQPRTAKLDSGWHGSLLDPPVAAPDFALTDPAGGTFRLSDQRGHPVLLFFGYTACPDVCPTELGTWRRVREMLGPDGERVRWVFITVDPERDTPERVGKYVRSAGHESFVGLTGSRAELEKVWRDYNVYVKKEEPKEPGGYYAVTHSALTYLVDRDGRLVLLWSFGTKAEDMAADLRRIMGKRG